MSIFDFIGSVIGYLLWFFFDAVSNYALAVFLLVLVINLLLLPAVIKRQKSAGKTAKINQKQQEIRKKYEKDQKKCNEELAKLYEQEGNPMSGCFVSMILPWLVLFGVYAAVTSPLKNTLHIPSEKITQAVEVLKEDSSTKYKFSKGNEELQIIRYFPEIKEKLTMFNEDELADIEEYSSGFDFCGLNLLNNPNESDFKEKLWLIPVLTFIVSLVTSVLTQKQTEANQAQAIGCMKFLPYTMPVVSGWLAYTFPGAIGFYWFLNALISSVQMLFLNKFYSPQKVNAKEEAARLALLELNESSVNKIK